jgi:hypothetical protein
MILNSSNLLLLPKKLKLQGDVLNNALIAHRYLKGNYEEINPLRLTNVY